MTDCIINGGAGEEAQAGDLIKPGPATGDEEPGEPFRVTYRTDEGEDTTHLRILDVEGDSMEPEIREDERPRLRLIPADHSPSRAEDVHIRDKVLWVVRRVVRTGCRRPG